MVQRQKSGGLAYGLTSIATVVLALVLLPPAMAATPQFSPPARLFFPGGDDLRWRPGRRGKSTSPGWTIAWGTGTCGTGVPPTVG
jgi:hypothetical protein